MFLVPTLAFNYFFYSVVRIIVAWGKDWIQDFLLYSNYCDAACVLPLTLPWPYPGCLRSGWGNTHLLMLLLLAVADCFYVSPPGLLPTLFIFSGVSGCPAVHSKQWQDKWLLSMLRSSIFSTLSWCNWLPLGRHLHCECVDHSVGVAELICSHTVDLLKLSLTRLARHMLISCTEHPQSIQDVPALLLVQQIRNKVNKFTR